jgi:hypothetical protein
LSAYALRAWRQEQLLAHQTHLHALDRQHRELVRKTAILDKASRFSARAHKLGLQPEAWTLYDVNVQAPLAFEAAQEIVYLCSDSSLAYYWPISLEIKAPNADQRKGAVSRAKPEVPADVQLSVKGRFTARRR